jgi:hypothetical protein
MHEALFLPLNVFMVCCLSTDISYLFIIAIVLSGQETEITAVGLHRADDATPSVSAKSWH